MKYAQHIAFLVTVIALVSILLYCAIPIKIEFDNGIPVPPTTWQMMCSLLGTATLMLMGAVFTAKP